MAVNRLFNQQSKRSAGVIAYNPVHLSYKIVQIAVFELLLDRAALYSAG